MIFSSPVTSLFTFLGISATISWKWDYVKKISENKKSPKVTFTGQIKHHEQYND
jgi:PKD repeat protein